MGGFLFQLLVPIAAQIQPTGCQAIQHGNVGRHSQKFEVHLQSDSHESAEVHEELILELKRRAHCFVQRSLDAQPMDARRAHSSTSYQSEGCWPPLDQLRRRAVKELGPLQWTAGA